MRILFWILAVAVTIAGSRPAFLSAQETKPDAAQGVNQFAVDLYHQLSKQKEAGNFFFAPSNISLALAMTMAGARGETAAEMAKALHFPALEGNEGHRQYAALLLGENLANEKKEYELALANRLWAQAGYPFLESYRTVTRDLYHAELAQLDFLKAAEASRQQINEWVAAQTKEKIQNLLPPDSVTRDTRLVLTSAIYFNGKWKKPFDKQRTLSEPFYLTPEKSIKMPLMSQQTQGGYWEGDGLKILDLPYQGDRLSLTIILPNEIDGLEKVEKQLNAQAIAAWRSKLRPRTVAVSLPKFKLTASVQLKEILQNLGMKLAFSNQADFSGMATSEKLRISDVFHKAFVDIHEEGTEAAAATGVVVERMSAPANPPPTFRADHPFLFLIYDRQTDVVLFAGRLVDPAE